MDRKEVLSKISTIAMDVFDNDEIELSFETTANDIEEWDSLSHISLVDEIEREFGIRFTLSEVSGTKNVGELIDTVLAHKNK